MEPSTLLAKVIKVSNEVLELNSNHLPYLLEDALFSDFSHKLRSVYIPVGLSYSVKSNGRIVFPNGTILSKTFFYPVVEGEGCIGLKNQPPFVRLSYQSNTDLSRTIDLSKNCLIETRILEKSMDVWTPHVYIWGDKQNMAKYSPSGGSRSFVGHYARGVYETLDYWIPSLAQCSSCHEGSRDNSGFKPLGPFYQRIDKPVVNTKGANISQLVLWKDFFGFKTPIKNSYVVSPLPKFMSPSVREYFDINCGHCHNPKGLAAGSGLFLDRAERNVINLGVCKYPVASGPSGDIETIYDIDPGKSAKSYLLQRMATNSPVQRMPELGRELLDHRGLSVVSEWINGLNFDCAINNHK